MTILIIEDELLTAKDLARTIANLRPAALILPFVQSIEEGRALMNTHPQLDLIFSDIELADGLSFEVLKHYPQIPVVFCTAYQQYALDAFHHFGIDYLLKPFDEGDVARALEKFDRLKTPAPLPYDKLLEAFLHQPLAQQKSLVIQQGDRIIPVAVDDIALIHYHDEIAELHLYNGDKLVAIETMDKLEQRLPPTFFRANRQVLIHRKAVKEARHHFHRKITVIPVIAFKESIIISKTKVTAFTSWLAHH